MSRSRAGVNKDGAKLLKQVEQILGPDSVVWTRSGHCKVITPMGPVFLSSTPSDRRSLLNARAELRRHGVDL